MKDILAIHFPEDSLGEPDVLAGLPDYSGGKATAYFSALAPEDREIVQWYVNQGISPVWVSEAYVIDLIKQYAVIDPERSSEGGVESAISEIERVRRYQALFGEASDYFPWIESFSSAVRDDDGYVIGTVEELAWGSVVQDPINNLQRLQRSARIHERIMVEAIKFIEDPHGSIEFDQAYILAKFKEKADLLRDATEDPDA